MEEIKKQFNVLKELIEKEEAVPTTETAVETIKFEETPKVIETTVEECKCTDGSECICKDCKCSKKEQECVKSSGGCPIFKKGNKEAAEVMRTLWPPVYDTNFCTDGEYCVTCVFLVCICLMLMISLIVMSIRNLVRF